MGNSTNELWSSVRKRVQTDSRYEILTPWMNQLHLLDSTGDSVAIALQDQALRPYITNQHMNLLEQAVSEELDASAHVHLTEERTATPAAETAEPDELHLNARYTLDTLVIGPSNRLACAAARAVAEQPGDTYNPLLLHGSVGMGKSHMLQAICHEIRRYHPAIRLIFVDAHAFVDQTQPAVLKQNQFESIDVLVVDNIHRLANHEEAQENFFACFSSLYNRQRQIVLSSDAPPTSLNGMRESLVSRFKWGLIVELETPTAEMKTEIIQRKTEERGATLPQPVQQFLAEHVAGNIRELEGAVKKLTGYASLLHQDVDMEVARHVLREYLPRSSPSNLTIKNIQIAACEAFSISLNDMLSKKRARSLVLPRHIAMYLVRIMTNASLEEVGLHFGGRDHSTVKHGCEKVQQLLETDASIQFTVNSIKRKLLATG